VPSTDTEPSRRFPDTSKTIGAPERALWRQSRRRGGISASAKRTLPRKKVTRRGGGRRKPNALRGFSWCCDLLGLDDAAIRERVLLRMDRVTSMTRHRWLPVSRAATGFFGHCFRPMKRFPARRWTFVVTLLGSLQLACHPGATGVIGASTSSPGSPISRPCGTTPFGASRASIPESPSSAKSGRTPRRRSRPRHSEAQEPRPRHRRILRGRGLAGRVRRRRVGTACRRPVHS